MDVIKICVKQTYSSGTRTLMNGEGTVTFWINQVKAGDFQTANDAFRNIWQHYAARMVGFAQRELRKSPPSLSDDEDVVQSVFRVAFQRARAGKLDHVSDREDLWKLLIGITASKIRDCVHKEMRQKRGGGNVHKEADLDGAIDEYAVTHLTPQLSVQLAEELERLLTLLGSQDDSLRVAAEMKMEGAENREIEQRLGCSSRSVERKLKRIRELWQQRLNYEERQ